MDRRACDGAAHGRRGILATGANAAFKALLGFTHDEVERKNLRDLLMGPDSDMEALNQAMQSLVAVGEARFALIIYR